MLTPAIPACLVIAGISPISKCQTIHKNWEITTIAVSRNLLVLITRYTVERNDVKFDPYVLSPCNVPQREDRKFVPIDRGLLFCRRRELYCKRTLVT